MGLRLGRAQKRYCLDPGMMKERCFGLMVELEIRSMGGAESQGYKKRSAWFLRP